VNAHRHQFEVPARAVLASRSRGYHLSGVAILRPSASVTTSSSAVKATETGLISPTSISKVLMPFAFEEVALRSQMTDHSADFMGGKSRIHCDREVVQSELGFAIASPDVDMRRLAAFVRIEERAIWPPAQHGRHSILVVWLFHEFPAIQFLRRRTRRVDSPQL
jgi:hypothetical protein